MSEKMIYIQEFAGEVVSYEDVELLFGDGNNMSYKHFQETRTYSDDVRIFENKEITNETKIAAEDWSNFTNKGEN